MIGNRDVLPGYADETADTARGADRGRRLLFSGISVLALLCGFAAYVRLSWTFPSNSDGASIALQAWQMMHGNPLLRGWLLADVSFYTTELPQYMLVELVHGLNAGVIHIAAAMTYTLVILMAALLARGRAAGYSAAAVLGGCVAAGIMLAPQLSDGVLVLLSSPDHIGTAVPVMLAWLIIDRARPDWRWRVTAGVPLLLGWAAIADALVIYVAIAPLVLVVAVRVVQALIRDRRDARGGIERDARGGIGRGLARQRREIALAAGAVLAAFAARLVLRLITNFGGFTGQAAKSHIASLHHVLGHNVPVVGHGLLLLFGADFLDYPTSVFLVLHLVGVLLAVLGVAIALWRFLPDRDFVSQLLLAGIVVNLAVFLASTSVAWLPTMREIDVVLPFSAALAGRQLGPRIAAAPRVASVALTAVLGLVGIGYVAGLAHDIAPAIPLASSQRLATWLETHHLSDGLSGYWESNVVTLTSGDRVRIRLVEIGHGPPGGGSGPGTLTAGVRESDSAWYDAGASFADFVVLSPGTGQFAGFTDRAAVVAAFGKPALTYHVAGYTVLVWPGVNLLSEVGPAVR